MAEMRGSTEGRKAFTRTVGRGSNWQVEGLDFRMRSEISESEGSWRKENEWDVRQGSGEVLTEELGTGGSDEFSDWKRTSGSYRKQLSTDGEGERPGVWEYCWEEKTVTWNYLYLNRLCQSSSWVWFEKCSPYNVKCDFCAYLYKQQDQFFVQSLKLSTFGFHLP